MSFYRTDKHTATCWFQITNIFYSRIISNIKYLVIYWNINFICYWIVPRNYKLFRTLENKIYSFILNSISYRSAYLYKLIVKLKQQSFDCAFFFFKSKSENINISLLDTKSQVSNGTGQVSLHQDISGLQVAVSYTWLSL